jgi:medium-chain acyl-[acyl-carrier-protein] hydrolase
MGARAGWIVKATIKPRARVRLFCVPSAGCGPSMYHHWSSRFGADVEVCAIGIPGREQLFAHKPIDRLTELVATSRGELDQHLDRPFAFFGHSMGAWLAFELARSLRRDGRTLPSHLFVSARRAPHTPVRWTPLHRLPDSDFIAAVQQRYGGIPQEALENGEILDLLLPVLRADFAAVETYGYSPAPPLPIPISAYGGSSDAWVLAEDLEAWRELTTKPFRRRMLEGAHFYLNGPALDSLLADLQAELHPFR